MPLFDPEHGAYSYIDSSGEWAIPPDYDVAGQFHNGFAVVRQYQASPWKFIDVNGSQVGPSSSWSLTEFNHGLAPFQLSMDELAGYTSGDWAIPQEFQRAEPFTPDGIAAVQNRQGLWGCIDIHGEYLIEPRFDLQYSASFHGFYEGRTWIEVQEPCWSSIVDGRNRERFLIREGGKAATIDSPPHRMIQCGVRLFNSTGEPVSQRVFRGARNFSEGVAVALLDGKYGLVGREGEWISPPAWKSIAEFSEGLAAVQNQEGDWGYVDRRGAVVIEPRYRSADEFSEGLAGVRRAGRQFTYIRPDGNRAFDRYFTRAGRFHGGIANVATKAYRSFEYINTEGETVYKYSIESREPN